ncbi:MAG: hypothetical protein JSV84_13905 [Gemmatimonadota bacterium]|nr:MAG: hypothetical protein JSV84_13905 [Gemmatimonadota bacterium]
MPEKNTKKSLFAEIPWLNGERAEYTIDWVRKSKEKISIGELVIENRLSKEMENDYISIITQTKMYHTSYTEEVTVLANKGDYKPIVTHISLQTPEGETIKVKGHYKGRKVDIYVETARAKHKTSMNVPLNVFDNYQAHFLIRSLLNTYTGYSASISAVHILKGVVTHPMLKVEAKEVVVVPAGKFVCWRISSKKELRNEVQQYILISEQRPHPMVKNVKGTQIIELTNYVMP